jgi:C4-dicarboxylate-specific signal transduction histidine kinase
VAHPNILSNRNLYEPLLPSLLRFGLSFWAWGGLFIAVYVLLERVSFLYQLDGLGITLWSPSAGASVILLVLLGVRFAPFVFVASLLTDFLIYTGPRGFFAPIGTSLVIAVGFAGLALALDKAWRSVREVGLARVVALLTIVPAGILVLATAYCLVLYLSGILFGHRFLVAVGNFWVGDTLGIITLVPAAVTVLRAQDSRRALSRARLLDAVVFAALLVGALWFIFGLRGAHEYQFFYLLFIPVVWIAVKAGYPGVSLALPVAHALIVTIGTTLGFGVYDFMAFQLLMLVLSATGLLLGAAVTESRHSAERMRMQEGELARATRQALVGATGTALAHEISQPLASTTNYLHAASRLLRASGRLPTEAAEALAKAEVEARRAREALERVRDYVSRGRLELTSVDLEAVTVKIVALLDGDARARGVRIDTSASPRLPPVLGDAIQLEQLLLNLAGNAIDAASTDDGRRGRVSVRLISQWKDRVVIEVEDDGPGVASCVADRLFEPFETTKHNGMGLGLTLARQIVEAHEGALRWQNLAPHGARFSVELRLGGPR